MAADATGVESVEIWRVSGLQGMRILAPLYYRLYRLDAERHPLGLSLSLPPLSYLEIPDLVPRFDSTRLRLFTQRARSRSRLKDKNNAPAAKVAGGMGRHSEAEEEMGRART